MKETKNVKRGQTDNDDNTIQFDDEKNIQNDSDNDDDDVRTVAALQFIC